MNTKKITSKANAEIKHLRKIILDRDYRYAQKEYAVEGVRALDGIKEAKKIFVCEGAEIPKIGSGCTYIVAENVFKSISSTENSQGVVVTAPLNILGASDIGKKLKYVLLDRLQDPGNLGTIIRTACAFGLQGVIVTPRCADPFSPKAARAAASSLWKMDIVRIEDIGELKDCNLIVADMKGRDISTFAWPDSFILCIGSEAGGVSPEVKSAAKDLVAIPMSTAIESLNAAVACGIMLYSAITSLECHS